jgi:hypothetical protein
VTAAQAEAHSAPFKSTPVVHTFWEGDKVSADEQAHDGWRRIHVPDGRIGFVRDEEVQLDAAPVSPVPKPESDTRALSKDQSAGSRATMMLPDWRIAFGDAEGSTLDSAPAPTPPPRAPAPTALARPVQPRPASPKRALVYVKNVEHLAELVEEDDVVSRMANNLATRHKVAKGAEWSSVVGVVLVVLSFTALKTQTCDGGLCVNRVNTTASIGGTLIIVGSLLASAAIAPSHADVLDVVDTWNRRHSDIPLAIGADGVGRY